MRSYKVLNKNVFQQNEFSIVPIRDKDKFDIMNWRNDQIFHLRQKEKLSKNSQEKYFKETVSNLFKINFPSQILFSFLKNDVCVGYGGLVHINWEDKNAEISFLMNTELEKYFFNQYWTIFLKLIENVAFDNLNFYKIFIYAFDLRKNLYVVLKQNNYEKEAELKGHHFHENKFIDVLIYSKIIKSENRIIN
jgi:RimJ/RimL family protein N-acetyltransferase